MNYHRVNHTILLGWFQDVSPNTSRMLAVVAGLCQIVLAFLSAQGLFMSFAGYWTFLVGGVLSLAVSWLGYAKNSPLAPKVSVDGEALYLRSTLLGKSMKISLDTLKKVEIGSYQLLFHTANEQIDFTYKTTKAKSQELKALIRGLAESRPITLS